MIMDTRSHYYPRREANCREGNTTKEDAKMSKQKTRLDAFFTAKRASLQPNLFRTYRKFISNEFLVYMALARLLPLFYEISGVLVFLGGRGLRTGSGVGDCLQTPQEPYWQTSHKRMFQRFALTSWTTNLKLGFHLVVWVIWIIGKDKNDWKDLVEIYLSMTQKTRKTPATAVSATQKTYAWMPFASGNRPTTQTTMFQLFLFMNMRFSDTHVLANTDKMAVCSTARFKEEVQKYKQWLYNKCSKEF